MVSEALTAEATQCSADLLIEMEEDRETERQRDKETERQRDRETERQCDRETEGQGDRCISVPADIFPGSVNDQ